MVVAAVLLLLLGLLWVFQRRLIYLPDTAPVPPAATVIPGARDITLTTRDGLKLTAWYVPAAPPGDLPNETSGDRAVTVLVTGGNAGNRLHRAPLARALAARGLPVLLMDYRGYGGNPGTPTEDGLFLDALAARDAIHTPKVIYFGESLGAAVATRLALERPPDGLVLRSPFTDLAAAGQVNYPFLPVRALLRDRFPVADAIAAVRAPVVVVYGTGDTTVPPDLSRTVAKAAGATAVEVPGAGHNDLTLLTGPELVGAVAELADRVRGRASTE
ncbi:alpha/beta hydrolase [[Actinomadura] parvosata subsp. kistnae]|uniref:Alpha/beta hydrolase n=1 Tax=[Actinomadura] parvosata subsp. kistnae TaxID=1909395 RepID=A0A1V0AKQ8_9ACTN|nr:alpha/beta hydrolase [Nonomuraea sp. ATCC 55076]